MPDLVARAAQGRLRQALFPSRPLAGNGDCFAPDVRSHLLPDVPALADDCLLLAALQRAAGTEAPSARARRIGIPGPDGRVYRVVVYDHAREHRLLTAVLHRLGFVAEPCEVGMTVFRRRAAGASRPLSGVA